MQDERKIVIEVVDRATPSPDRPRPKPEDQTPAQEAVDQTGESNALLLGKSILYNQIYSAAKDQLNTVAENAIHRYFQMREDYKGEQNYANAKASISKAVGFVAAITTGLKSGARFGGIGAITGVLVAGASYGISDMIQGNIRINNAKIALNNQEYDSAFQRSRAGLMDGGRGTRG